MIMIEITVVSFMIITVVVAWKGPRIYGVDLVREVKNNQKQQSKTDSPDKPVEGAGSFSHNVTHPRVAATPPPAPLRSSATGDESSTLQSSSKASDSIIADGKNDSDVVILDEIAARVLGDDPNQPQLQKNNVHPQLIVRWCTWINDGLGKDKLSALLESYEAMSKLSAHKINPELAHTLSDKAKKRDSYFLNTQKIAGAALTALGLATSSLLSNDKEINREFLLEKLHDTGKLISQLHHGQLVGRRACIIPLVKKNLRQVMCDLKSDEFLFGENLSSNIKKFIGDGKNNLILDDYSYKKDFNAAHSRNSKSNYQNSNNRNPNYSRKR
ncbi:hypothetical protein TKK_0019148 [Trichogramma kaykai]